MEFPYAMPEIYLGVIDAASIEQREKDGIRQRKIRAYLSEFPKVIHYERKQTPHFWLERVDEMRRFGSACIASRENPLVTPCAGAVSVFYDKDGEVSFVSFSQKDAAAERNPEFRVPRNGFPQSEEDWYTNAHLYREAFEEGIFITRVGHELVLGTETKYDAIIESVAKHLEEKAKIKIYGTRRVPIIFREGNDTLKIATENGQKSIEDKGVLCWTPEIGFNFIKVMEVQYPLEELLLLDGETFPNGELIGRDTCVMDLKHLRGKTFGDPITETIHSYNKETGEVRIYTRDDKFLTSKTPRAVLRQIEIDGMPVYPADWMDESYAFLSREDVLAEFYCFGWAGLERKIKENDISSQK